MKIKDAREYYELGILRGFYAVRDPLVSGSWLLCIEGENERSWTLQTAKGGVKSFSSLDTLVGEIESITGRVSSLHTRI